MTDFHPNHEGIGFMLCASWMQQDMRKRALSVLAHAESIAPVAVAGSWRSGGHDPGEYARSFRVSSGVKSTGDGARAYGRVENVSSYALAVEYGWRYTPKYRVLGRSLSAAGDRGTSPYVGDPTRSHRAIQEAKRAERRETRRARKAERAADPAKARQHEHRKRIREGLRKAREEDEGVD